MTGVSLEFRWPCLLLRGSKKSYYAHTHTHTLRLGRGRQSSSRETERKVGQHLEDKTALNTRTLACGKDVRVHSCSKTEKNPRNLIPVLGSFMLCMCVYQFQYHIHITKPVFSELYEPVLPPTA